jgi:hypothetical protein
MRSLPSLSLPFLCAALVAAQNTLKIYQPKNQVIYGGTYLHLTATTTAAVSNFTNAAAYDQTVLNAPPVPNPAIPTSVPIQLQSSGVSSNISLPVNGGFFGISIEMSVANQVCELSSFSSSRNLINATSVGRNRYALLFHVSLIQPYPPQRMIAPHCRFHSLISWQTSSNGPAGSRSVWVVILKRAQSWSRLSQMAPCSRKIPTPLLVPRALHPWSIHLTCYTPWRTSPNSQIPTGTLVGYLVSPCSSSLKLIQLGIPFIDANTQNVSLAIMEHGQAILGNNLLGLQAGNEPDLYAAHGHRPAVRSPALNGTFN